MTSLNLYDDHLINGNLPPLPKNLTALNVCCGSSLTALPNNLPPGLKQLDLLGCRSLIALPDNLPQGLEKLDLSDCRSLTALPDNLPQGLKELLLNACVSLRASPKLIAQLEDLEAAGCIVEWPANLSRQGIIGKAKAKLTAILNKYKEQNPSTSRADHLEHLVNRYLNEGIGQRGGAKEVVASVNPILDFLANNPHHLALIDEIAGRYLDGCVNQPVAGWSEIVAWLAVAKAKDGNYKIEIAKRVIVLDALRTFVATSEPKPKAGVEVEAGNALLREVHKKLTENGDITPWFGVPGPIAYEKTISSWLTEDKTKDAYELVKLKLNLCQSETLEVLCINYLETFAQIAFPHTKKTVEGKYHKQKLALGKALEFKAQNLTYSEAKRDAKNNGYLDKFNAHSDKTTKELETELRKLDLTMLQELAAKIKSLDAIALEKAIKVQAEATINMGPAIATLLAIGGITVAANYCKSETNQNHALSFAQTSISIFAITYAALAICDYIRKGILTASSRSQTRLRA
jgi:hypothetical protein